MEIICSICSEVIHPQSEAIVVTKCGHLFHKTCLEKWKNIKQTCPECRSNLKNSNATRLYLNVQQSEENGDEPSLQVQLSNTKYSLLELRTDLKKTKDAEKTLRAELDITNEKLKKCMFDLKKSQEAKEAINSTLQYMKIQMKETQKIKDEYTNMKEQLSTLTGLQEVLNATSEEVDNILAVYTDIKTIAVFAAALKRALFESEKKKSETRVLLQTVQHQLSIARDENNLLRSRPKINVMRENDDVPIPHQNIENRDPDRSETKFPKRDGDQAPYLTLKQSSLAFVALKPKYDRNTSKTQIKNRDEVNSGHSKLSLKRKTNERINYIPPIVSKLETTEKNSEEKATNTQHLDGPSMKKSRIVQQEISKTNSSKEVALDFFCASTSKSSFKHPSQSSSSRNDIYRTSSNRNEQKK